MLSFFPESKKIRAVMSVAEDGPIERASATGQADRLLSGSGYRRFLGRAGFDWKKAVALELQAGKRAGILDSFPKGGLYVNADGLVTTLSGIGLTATAADCALVFLAEEKAGVVGICHAGWRGAVKGVVPNTVKKMILAGGVPSKIKVAISPALGACCFEIKEDVATVFREAGWGDFVRNKKGRLFLDLKGVIKEQLLESGIKSKNITINPDCTFCNSKYFSYRRNRIETTTPTLLMVGAIQRL